jgi:hypothetical protein
MINLYQLLNVSPLANINEIKYAYNKIKLSTEDKSTLWLIDEAYFVLGCFCPKPRNCKKLSS